MSEANSANFLEGIIESDLKSGKHDKIITRFPPEPNGYLHIGHAKAIWVNFGLAKKFDGICNLRFDDTNPSKENQEYVDAIKEDIRWLGYDWDDRLYFASDYFEQLYQWAIKLIEKGLAYVEDLTAEQIREYRGTLKEPGRPSPFRDRSIEENLELFAAMRAGKFEDGERVLRAKIDMAAPNINLRDPVLYRIQREHHHRTGDEWCIYPMYDFAHGQSDSIEGITHSFCTLEFEDHRPLYNWLTEALEIYPPRQIEYARLNITRTVLSKRKLRLLVEEGYVSGWDDPRMPTLSAMRRRGYTPEAIIEFCERLGVSKANSMAEMAMLEHSLRQDLNQKAARYMAVLDPVPLEIENYPEGQVEWLEAVNNPERPEDGTRKVPFSKKLWVERSDFREDPPKKYWRLAPGQEVRLRYGYLVTCTGFEKDPNTGEVTKILCKYDPETKGGNAPDGRRVRGTIHWVAKEHSGEAEVRLYDVLFNRDNPNKLAEGESFEDTINPNSMEVLKHVKVEHALKESPPTETIQFERQGYFVSDKDSSPERSVWNRTVTLRDSWAKMEKKQK